MVNYFIGNKLFLITIIHNSGKMENLLLVKIFKVFRFEIQRFKLIINSLDETHLNEARIPSDFRFKTCFNKR